MTGRTDRGRDGRTDLWPLLTVLFALIPKRQPKKEASVEHIRDLARWDCAAGSCAHDGPCPRNGDLFPDVATALADHPQECASRAGIWRGHWGGRSCPSDLDDCDDCRVTFYNEYVRRFEDARLDPEDGWPIDVVLCDCCLQARQNGGAAPVAFSAKDPTPEEQARWTR